MARGLVLLACNAVGAAAISVARAGETAAAEVPRFDDFMQLHDRAYAAGSEEYRMRRALYEARAREAERQNSSPHRLWTASANDLWDRTEEELGAMRGWVGGARPASRSGGVFIQAAGAPLPEEKDWTDLKAMKLIHSQGGCGSCWAIASTTMLQAHAEIHTTASRTFSAQQLVSCVPNPKKCGGGGGCTGATVELAMDWVMGHGLAEDFQVPYVGQDGTCHEEGGFTGFLASPSMPSFGSGSTTFGMHGWETLPLNKMEPLMRALAERGPVAVSVDASPWHAYGRGIFDGCPADAIINHAVVAVGYGKDKATGTKFWRIQNSWGRKWGEGGFIRVLRRDDDDSRCGIDNKPELGTGCEGGPPEVTVCGMCGVLYDSVVPHFATA